MEITPWNLHVCIIKFVYNEISTIKIAHNRIRSMKIAQQKPLDRTCKIISTLSS